MPIPDYQTLMLPVLRVLGDGADHTAASVIDALATEFNLTLEEREQLVGNQRIKVIALPPNLFYSTTIPACLLIFRATKPAEHQGHVLFVDGSARFVKGRKQNQMSEPDIEAVLAAYRGRDVGDVAIELVDHGQIKDNGWDLNISRYLKGAVAEAVTIDAALEQLAAAQVSLHEAEARLAERLKLAGYA